MLQDGIFAQNAWLSQPGNADIATRFLAASFEGWMWCRDNFDACVQDVLDNGPTLGKGHQTWQLNEINALIWPSPDGIGNMDSDAWARTVDVAKQGQIITADPPSTAYRTDLAAAARALLSGDVNGTSYTKQTVQVTPGGN
jgi:NitT/TauT family transport system substrate-binding protein